MTQPLGPFEQGHIWRKLREELDEVRSQIAALEIARKEMGDRLDYSQIHDYVADSEADTDVE